MPYCQYCHEEISKFDNDLCPHCGKAHPIAEGYKTMDITKTMTRVEGHYAMPKTRSLRHFALLSMLFGYFGVHDFYIYRPRRAIVEILVTVVFTLGIGLPLFFTVLPNALAFVLPFMLIWIAHVVMGFLYLKVESPKDGKGEFLR